MEKLSRNAPCPCGSGKKYKRCCLGKVIDFPKKDGFDEEKLDSVSKILEHVKESLLHREFYTLEEMNEEINEEMDSFYQNNLPRAQFLGLSSTNMNHILYEPFSLKNEVFDFKYEGNDHLIKIPFLKQAFYFLKKLNDVGELKATQKGNLPRAFVVELYHQFFSGELYARIPNREGDLFQVTRLKYILNASGLIKKRFNKFSLTKKGKKIFLGNKIHELFYELTLAFFNKWNWGYGDRYFEFWLIQSSAIFNLYLIHKKAQNWILDKELGKIYFDAFPNLANEARGGYFSPEETIIKCFSLRFLNRFCLPMGFLLSKSEGDFFNRKTFYKVSPFFRQAFNFHI